MILLDKITFGYKPQQAVFKEWSWKAEKGETWCVLGPSGCGKSTLLLLLAGLLHPQNGIVAIEDERLIRPRPGTGLVLQEYGLLPWATIEDNVALGWKIRQFYGPDGRHVPRNARTSPVAARESVDYWLNRLGIKGITRQYPGQVSGGQRQRAAIARTLALEPDLLLLDEPFSALDAPTRENLELLTIGLAEEVGLTIILVTHSIEEAAFVGQRILLLGQPPNTSSLTLDNFHKAEPEYKFTTGYRMIVDLLREKVNQS